MMTRFSCESRSENCLISLPNNAPVSSPLICRPDIEQTSKAKNVKGQGSPPMCRERRLSPRGSGPQRKGYFGRSNQSWAGAGPAPATTRRLRLRVRPGPAARLRKAPGFMPAEFYVMHRLGCRSPCQGPDHGRYRTYSTSQTTSRPPTQQTC